MDYVWTCKSCGKQHQTLPLDFAVEAPHHWSALSETERVSRAKLDSDVCVIDGKDIFVRGCLELPIIGIDQKFVWGSWVSVSKNSFARIVELWNAEIPPNEPALFGWFCNNLPLYPTTLGLKTHLHLRSGGLRPAIELEPTDHPLALEQRQGISLARVEEIASSLLTRH